LLVLPAKAPAATRQALQSLAGAWQRFLLSGAEMVKDDELETLPHDRTVWLLGSSNRFAPEVVAALKEQGVSREGAKLTLPQGDHDLARESVVLVARRHPDDPHALVWLAGDRPQAIPGLARKLPHYRKYSYLVFSGDAPDNQLKGQWPVLASPMSVHLEAGAEMGKLAPRQPLAQLPAQGG
jgi:aminopeptidase N